MVYYVRSSFKGVSMKIILKCPKCQETSSMDVSWWKTYPDGKIEYRVRCKCSKPSQSIFFKNENKKP